jgi:hypothetical protein
MKNLSWIYFLLLITFSCSKDDNSVIDGNINSDIEVTIRHSQPNVSNRLVFDSETVELQSCSSHTIITEYEIMEDNIKIEYSGINKPDACYAVLSPATTNHFFDLSNGEYSVEFINDGISNTASLSVDDGKYIIKLISASNIVLTTDTLNRSFLAHSSD